MQIEHQNPKATKLGEIVIAAYDLGSAVASDPATAGDLAARHLERLLLRGGNARVVAALADLAQDLAPTGRHSRRSRAPGPRRVSTEFSAAR